MIRFTSHLFSAISRPLVQSAFISKRFKVNICHKMSSPTAVPHSPTTSKPQFYRRVLPDTCIPFSSQEGKLLFKEALLAGHMEGYFGLAAQFRTQDEPAFCGLSTLVMVLNTLEVDPKRVWKGPWRWYHENMLDCCVPLDIAAKDGVTLDELACLASCNTLSVKMVRMAGSATEEGFRKVVKDLTGRDDEVLIASYSRAVLGQTGDGHFSPIAGYHEERDLVLILDTARFKYPPHWVSLPLIYKSMQACDKNTGQPRGYMQLRKSDKVPMVLFRVGESLSLTSIGNQDDDDDDATGTGSLDPFLGAWKAWMDQPSGEEMSPTDIFESAAITMIDSLQKLPEHDCILTTQVDVSCPETLSVTHSCVIEDLLASLEDLPLYRIVEKQLGERGPVPCLYTEVDEFAQKSPPCRHANLGSCPSVENQEREEGTGSDALLLADCLLQLTPAHMVTILVCAWPAFRCSVTNCNHLRKAVQAELFKTSTVLQDEVAQLSKQLNSILAYRSDCYHCDCKK